MCVLIKVNKNTLQFLTRDDTHLNKGNLVHMLLVCVWDAFDMQCQIAQIMRKEKLSWLVNAWQPHSLVRTLGLVPWSFKAVSIGHEGYSISGNNITSGSKPVRKFSHSKMSSNNNIASCLGCFTYSSVSLAISSGALFVLGLQEKGELFFLKCWLWRGGGGAYTAFMVHSVRILLGTVLTSTSPFS